MRVDRRDILPTMPKAAFTAALTVHAVNGSRGRHVFPLAR
jgi:hypothetical protein